MNTSKILVFTLLFFSILKTETINAQIESANKKKDNLKGPICLYKKTVQKDFLEKFGEYEPGNSTIAAWYIYDKEGRKGLCATNLWLDRADHLYYSGFENLKEPQIIYQMSLKDSIPVALFKGTHPSIGQ